MVAQPSETSKPSHLFFITCAEHTRDPFLNQFSSSNSTFQSFSQKSACTMDAQTQVDISKLNDADKNELSQMLANEQQKATMQQSELI